MAIEKYSSRLTSSVGQAQEKFAPRLPDEILLRIFSLLSPNELKKCEHVCKQWDVVAKDESLWIPFLKLFPKFKVLDETVWREHCDVEKLGLSFKELPPFSARLNVQALIALEGKIQGDAGGTEVTIPEGLTFDKIRAIASAPKKGPSIKCNIWHVTEAWCSKEPTAKAYRVFVTNSILIGSTNKHYESHKTMVREIGFEMPRLLSYASLIVLTRLAKGIHLFEHNEWIYTGLLEEVDFGHCHMLLEGINYYTNSFKIDIYDIPSEMRGIGAQRELIDHRDIKRLI